ARETVDVGRLVVGLLVSEVGLGYGRFTGRRLERGPGLGGHRLGGVRLGRKHRPPRCGGVVEDRADLALDRLLYLAQLAQRPSDLAADLGQPLRAEHDQREDEDNKDLGGAETHRLPFAASRSFEWSFEAMLPGG